MKSASTGVQAFKILSSNGSSMRIGMNSGEVYTCQLISKTPKMPQVDPMTQFVQQMNKRAEETQRQTALMFEKMERDRAASAETLNMMMSGSSATAANPYGFGAAAGCGTSNPFGGSSNSFGGGGAPFGGSTNSFGGGFGRGGASMPSSHQFVPSYTSASVSNTSSTNTSSGSSSFGQAVAQEFATSAAGAMGEAAGEFVAGTGFSIGGAVLGSLFGGF